MSNKRDRSVKRSKEVKVPKDPNWELGMKTAFILLLWVMIDCELVTKDNIGYVRERFVKTLEMYVEGRIKFSDIIQTLKEEYGYTRVDF